MLFPCDGFALKCFSCPYAAVLDACPAANGTCEALLGDELWDARRSKLVPLDTEGGGVLTTADLKKVMSESGNTDAEVAELMKKIDLDNDGEIDWKEFVAAMMCEHTLFNEENLEKVFKSIDTDGSGALCQKEIAGLLGDDSELAREILEDLKMERGEDPSNDVSEIRMTLDEFKALLSSQYRGKAALLSPRSRKRHTKRAPDGTRTPREQKV